MEKLFLPENADVLEMIRTNTEREGVPEPEAAPVEAPTGASRLRGVVPTTVTRRQCHLFLCVCPCALQHTRLCWRVTRASTSAYGRSWTRSGAGIPVISSGHWKQCCSTSCRYARVPASCVHMRWLT